jgi:tRNA(adenine34) deaminase
LIGFGKSDKPKREGAHSLAFHCQYLLEWLERMELENVTLVAPHVDHPLVLGLMTQARDRIRGLLVQPIESIDTEAAFQQVPYPDAGHRAAERAFLSLRLG